MNYKKNKLHIPTPLLFVIAILIITFFCPREGKFKYSYIEGKPWKYGLLTASFDFPIYKSDAQIKKETDSVLSNYQPYYIQDSSVLSHALTTLENDAKKDNMAKEYVDYVAMKLKELYRSGIVSTADFDQIDNTNSRQLKIVVDNVAKSYNISSFRTSKSAYEELIDCRPEKLELSVLKSMNINDYFSENILFDRETSTKAKADLMSKISMASGMVQSGEKIIDRGEIISPKTYLILNSLKKITEERIGSKTQQGWLILGDFILVFTFVMAFMTYLAFFRQREYSDRKNVIFMLLMIALFAVLTGITIDYSLFNIYIIPFAVPTIMVRTFIDSRTAMMTHMITIMISSIMVPFPAEFMLLQLSVGLMCIFSLKDLSERSQLIKSSFFILLTYIVVYTGYILALEGDILRVNWKMFVYFGINFIFLMFSYLLVYICEKIFGFISGVSMIELSNTNKPLLQKLSEVAPGTFQHSMQVSNLAAAVATRLGANASLVRTGALYHDIGKISNPIYFTENQDPGIDPHKKLSYKESAKIIINHVAEGIKIAQKYNLPQQIVDFIATHHGAGKAKFFYNSYQNDHPEEVVDVQDFSYPGPNPFSKETAILMMADTVEAASRSLSEYTEKSISLLVEKLIDSLVDDGLLKNAPITFKDIELAKSIFREKLMTIYHSRITYPELVGSEKE